jgi:hypothetical protein
VAELSRVRCRYCHVAECSCVRCRYRHLAVLSYVRFRYRHLAELSSVRIEYAAPYAVRYDAILLSESLTFLKRLSIDV